MPIDQAKLDERARALSQEWVRVHGVPLPPGPVARCIAELQLRVERLETQLEEHLAIERRRLELEALDNEVDESAT